MKKFLLNWLAWVLFIVGVWINLGIIRELFDVGYCAEKNAIAVWLVSGLFLTIWYLIIFKKEGK